LRVPSFSFLRGFGLASIDQNRIYKICRRHEWEAAERDRVFRGSPDDQRDGFIHFSTAEHVPGTLEKYFAGESGLVLIAVDAGALGTALKWEPSRGGALFPHLYGELPLGDAVLWSRPLSAISDLKQLEQ
jgi:uncharacterized protein (DUF952 family)